MIGRARVAILFVILLFANLSCAGLARKPMPSSVESATNVILFIADGAGAAHFTMGREYARYLGLRDVLYLDRYQVGAVQTHSAKERVTDSASSATAYSTGVKTYNGAIGVDTLRDALPTVVDAAERKGMATGLVASSRITHATPASFSAHVTDRWMEDEIAAQQIRSGVDVMFGGGRRHFLPAGEGGEREDGRNLLQEAEELGYLVPAEDADVASIDRTPVLGLFASSHLPYAIDRTQGEPDLAELTSKAIELLSEDEDGFFLMVEGSRIDHASHENDAAAAVRDVIDYDNAFRVALDFARQDGRTLIVAVSDHETGGLSLGRAVPSLEMPVDAVPTFWQSLYGEAEYAWHPGVLADVTRSAGEIARAIEAKPGEIRAIMDEGAGIDKLADTEHAAIRQALENESGLLLVVGEIIARRALIGWTTDGHTGSDVNLYAFGPTSERLRGNIDNTAVGRHIFDVLGVGPEFLRQAPAGE